MKNLLVSSLFILSASLASQAQAQIAADQNLISCQNVNGFLSKCRVQDAVLAPAPAFDSEYRISYKATCPRGSGKPMSKIKVKMANGPGIYLSYGESLENVLVGTGSGALTLTHEKANDIEFYSFRECSLYITGYSITMSEQSLRNIETQIQGLKDLADAHFDSLESLEAIKTYHDLYIAGDMTKSGLQKVIDALLTKGDPISKRQADILSKVITEGSALDLNAEIETVRGEIVSTKEDLLQLKATLVGQRAEILSLIDNAVDTISGRLSLVL